MIDCQLLSSRPFDLHSPHHNLHTEMLGGVSLGGGHGPGGELAVRKTSSPLPFKSCHKTRRRSLLALALGVVCFCGAISCGVASSSPVLLCSSLDGPHCPVINGRLPPSTGGTSRQALLSYQVRESEGVTREVDIFVGGEDAVVKSFDKSFESALKLRGATTTGYGKGLLRVSPRLPKQSSVAAESSATKALDGMKGPNGSHMAFTKVQRDPWWQVDLGASTPVQVVEVWNCSPTAPPPLLLLSSARFPHAVCSAEESGATAQTGEAEAAAAQEVEQCTVIEDALQVADVALEPDSCVWIHKEVLEVTKELGGANPAASFHHRVCRWVVGDHHASPARYLRIQAAGKTQLVLGEVEVWANGGEEQGNTPSRSRRTSAPPGAEVIEKIFGFSWDGQWVEVAVESASEEARGSAEDGDGQEVIKVVMPDPSDGAVLVKLPPELRNANGVQIIEILRILEKRLQEEQKKAKVRRKEGDEQQQQQHHQEL
jgi:hypothetical protein